MRIYTPAEIAALQKAARGVFRGPIGGKTSGFERPRIVGLSRRGKAAVGLAAAVYDPRRDDRAGPYKVRGMVRHDYSSLVERERVRHVAPSGLVRDLVPAPAYVPKAGGLVMQSVKAVAQSRAGVGQEFAYHMRCQPRPDDAMRVERHRDGGVKRSARFVPWCKE